MFTPTLGDFEDACMDQTNGLGFDLVLDFSSNHVPTGGIKMGQVSRKREILAVLGIMGIWACAAASFQIDPPEAILMTEKRVTVALIGCD